MKLLFFLKNHNNKIYKLSLLIFLILNLLSIFFLFYIYFNKIDKNQVIMMIPAPIRQLGDKTIRNIVDLPYFKYYFMKSELPVYEIKIDEDRLRKLNENLPGPEDNWTLQEKHKITKKADFFSSDKKYDVRVRYRGSGSWHWLYQKKSWRINFENADNPFNTKKINFIVPFDRRYLAEAFSNWRAEKLGLKVPKNYFAELKVNGKNNGIYYVIESLGEEFLEKAQLNPDTNFYTESDLNLPIFEDLQHWDKKSKNPDTKINDYSDLYSLLTILNEYNDEEFLNNIWNIIDRESFLKWSVHSALNGSIHQDYSHNAQLYFDKTIGKFKILPYDVGINVINSSININYHPILTRVLKDKAFVANRNKLLWEYVKTDKNLKKDLKYYDDLYEKVKIAFYKDKRREFTNKFFDKVVKSQRQLIIDNYNKIKKELAHTNSQALIFYNYANNIPIALEIKVESITNNVLESISVKNLAKNNSLFLYEDTNNNKKFDIEDKLLKKSSFIEKDKSLEFKNINKIIEPELDINKNTNKEKIYEIIKLKDKTVRLFIVSNNTKFNNNIKLNIKIKNILTNKISDLNKKYINKKIFEYLSDANQSLNSFIKKYPIFYKNNKNEVAIGPGNFYITENIIIPKNISIKINPGTTFYLAKNISIISYSNIIAKSTNSLPIQFLNTNKNWGVLGIISADKESVFENVIFKNGSNSTINGISMSGMLSSYSSNIKINNSFFEGALGDDALNVKNADTAIYNNTFINNHNDAIDLDFTTGKIEGNSFNQNGNDSIDLSGSKIIIKNNKVFNSGDKCISIGEKTYVEIINNYLERCIIGIAVKDLSEAQINNNQILKNDIGISVYRKKEIFGGAYANLTNNNFTDNKKNTSNDDLSTIIQ